MNEVDLLAHSLGPAPLFAPLYDRLGCVHAGHCGDTAKSNEKAHTGAVTATQVHTPLPGPDLGALGQIRGGLEASTAAPSAVPTVRPRLLSRRRVRPRVCSRLQGSCSTPQILGLRLFP